MERTKSIWTVHYTTNRGYDVHFGTHGWVYVNCSPSHSDDEVREIWQQWTKHWNP